MIWLQETSPLGDDDGFRKVPAAIVDRKVECTGFNTQETVQIRFYSAHQNEFSDYKHGETMVVHQDCVRGFKL